MGTCANNTMCATVALNMLFRIAGEIAIRWLVMAMLQGLLSTHWSRWSVPVVCLQVRQWTRHRCTCVCTPMVSSCSEDCIQRGINTHTTCLSAGFVWTHVDGEEMVLPACPDGLGTSCAPPSGHLYSAIGCNATPRFRNFS